MELLNRWRNTRTSPEAREEARRLAAQVQVALQERRLEDALASAQRLHSISQNDAKLHVQAHWIHAKIYLATARKRQVLLHLYLGVMAPYGTLRRRLES